jgi:membrane-associated PAP2 superfamily phosphatase
MARQQRARNSAMSMSGPWQVVQSGLDRLEVVLMTRRIETGPGRQTVVGHASAIHGVCALGGWSVLAATREVGMSRTTGAAGGTLKPLSEPGSREWAQDQDPPV